MSHPSFVTPQTEDGVVSEVLGWEDGRCRCRFRVPLKPRFVDLVRGREAELVFASRSRLARLGIEVTPDGPIRLDGDVAELEMAIESAIPSYGIGTMLPQVVVPGLRLGRFVFCPEENRLTSVDLLAEVDAGSLQLPARFSIDDEGVFTIQPHRRIYDLTRELTRDDVISILATREGRSALNRLQIGRDVENIVMQPGTGVITSCSMFLHRHYVVLDRESHRLGRHLQATVLDPIRTRGTRVFLEFTNCSDRTIVNPSVSARVYRAIEVEPQPRAFPVVVPPGLAADAKPQRAFEAVRLLFDRLEGGVGRSYFDRLVAVVDDWDAIDAGGEPRWRWQPPARDADDIDSLRATRDYGSGKAPLFGTSILADVPPGTRATVLLGYFPNLVEHMQICTAALEGRIERLVFRRASFEHGPFLSAKDQSRLADYKSLGVEVYWCNDEWGHLAVHTFRGLRGYFVEPHKEERFQNALIVAIYGSARPLHDQDVTKLRGLLAGLKALFGDNLAILTGGGPGAMQQAADIAHEFGLLVGANYIETVDQGTNKSADFYQCFQDISRHNRQRWFEIASFQIFCTGGLGTLEEIGLTLTDMKLGVIERAPLVFFGRHNGSPYWEPLAAQFRSMVEDERAPGWMLENVLLTDEPDAVPPFYKRILDLG